MKPLKTLFRTGLTNLSFFKKWMMRLSIAGLIGGGAMQAYAMSQGDGGEGAFSLFSLRSGVGFLGGFLIGVAARIFLKVTAMLGLALAALGYLLQKIGWVELPWDSFSDIAAAFATAVEENTSRFKDFLSSYLPAGVTSAVGLGSGVTQKPEFDED